MTAAEALGPHLRAFPVLEVAKTACGQEVHLSAGCEEERHQLTGVHVVMVPGEGTGVVLRDCLAKYQEQAMTMTYYPWSRPALEKGNHPQGGYLHHSKTMVTFSRELPLINSNFIPQVCLYIS